jgi:plasmid stabilization system protein ParE
MRIKRLDSAILDLQRLKEFVLPHSKEAVIRAVRLIRIAVTPVASNPSIGKPVGDLPSFHYLFIPFGASGYVRRCRLVLSH